MMEKFKVTSAKLITSSDTNHWGGVFCENGIFIILETIGSEDSPANQKGRELMDILLTKVSSVEEKNLQVLEDMANFAKQFEYIKTLTLGFLVEDILYLSNLGIGQVSLVRSKRFGSILSSGEKSHGKVFPGDRIIFCSATIIDHIDNNKLEQLLNSQSLTQGIEDAYAVLVGDTNTVGAAALILELAKKKEEIAPRKPHRLFSDLMKNKLQIISEFIAQKRQNLWVDEEESKSKKTLLTVAIILIFLLIASIFLNINHSQTSNKQKLLEQTLDLVNHKYDEAVSLIDLNSVRARTLLSDSKLSLSQILKEFPKNSKEYKEIDGWLTKVMEKEVEAYKIYKITSVPIFFDINLVKTQGVGSKISLYKKTAVILDLQNKTVYKLLLDTKQAGIIAGSEVVKDAKSVAVHGKLAYILTSEGIVQVDLATKSSKLIIKTDKDWGEIGKIVSFGGNLYLLDKKNNAVWKYIAMENGFSERTSYLNPDVKIQLEKAQDFMIDGSVWILVNPSALVKFASGLMADFSIKGLADSLSDINTFFTSDETKRLYVLDKNLKRILVFDKDGNYQEQYQWDELVNANDFVVLEEEKKIYVLVANKIYAIDLK